MPSKVAAFPPSAEVIYPAPLVMFELFKVIFPVPSKFTPEIDLAVASFVAVAALPVQEADEPVIFELIVAGNLASDIVPAFYNKIPLDHLKYLHLYHYQNLHLQR